ncbi:MAG TPA: outer membrane lipoprotein chaperone LolA [Woeseiaceae bacterium]|nr:outer membrane lipoprotein chaperone LolA [Woeseiaceae bacterium]
MIKFHVLKVTLAVTGLCYAGLAMAEDRAQSEGELLLERFLNDVSSLSARFEQTLVDDADVVVDESAGTVEIVRPGRFRWANSEPYEQLLVADGVNVWNYDADLMQVTVRPQQEILQSTPALLLGGSSDALADFEYVGSFTDRGTVWVRLRPRESDSSFERVELGFTDGQLSRMIFSDNLQQKTLIALFDVVMNGEIPADRFEFVPPPGVDVVGVPVVSDAAD